MKFILTNDPSITAWGYGIVTYAGKVIQVGCIKTEPSNKKLRIRSGDDIVRRIDYIVKYLQDLIKKYPIGCILSELPHGSQNAKAAMMIGAVASIMQTLSTVYDIGVEWYSENDVKKTLFNRKSVSKQEMIKYVDSKLQVEWCRIKYKDEAVADALGVYLTAVQCSNFLKLIKNQ